ncbi:MAG TPA: MMPL family transporter [Frankiaceae bacterium]|jgi:RND superfamily putative drug exporter|nr:MMPL family transporter [Frankiaceae bacterium]
MAHWCYRHRRLVLILWVVGFIAMGAISNGVGSKYANSFTLPATDSSRALKLLQTEFPAASGETDTIVWHVKQGRVTDPATVARISPMLVKVGKLPHIKAVVSPYTAAGARQISKDGTIAYANVVFAGTGPAIPTSAAKNVITTAQAVATSNLQVELGGPAIQDAGGRPATGLSEVIGIIAAGVVIFLAFGSLLAMLLPLITALVGIGTGLSMVSLLSHVFHIAIFGPTLATLIGLGVGVDYALFIVSRHRANLRRGMDLETSTVLSINTSGRAVIFAGVTVCIALLGLLTVGVSFLYGLAVSAAIVVAFTVVSSVTLLPALLGFFGMKVLSKRSRRQLAEEGPAGERLSPRWWAWGKLVERRPIVLATAAAIILVFLAIPFLSLRLGSSDEGNNPPSTTTRKAYDLLATGFGPGFNGPFTVVVATQGSNDLPRVANLATALRATPGVAQVQAPQLSPSGKAAIISVVPTTSPQAAQTTSLLHHLRREVIPDSAPGMTVYVGGLTPIFADFTGVIDAKLPLFIGIVVGLAFILLATAFRSLLIPLTASVCNLLAAGAAFGVVTAVFQFGWGGSVIGIGKAGPVEPFLPVMMFAILFGLSMDYEVFLVSRMHEDWLHSGDNHDAVTRGQAETGQVITAAATIMVLVFASFVFGGERIIKEFGIGLATAILIDALLVRTVLVPSAMHLIGPSNWWLPRWLDRVLPRISVEGPDVADPPAEPERDAPQAPEEVVRS